VIDYANHQCLATRNYGTPEKPVVLALKPSPMGELVQLSVAMQRRRVGPREVPAEIRIGDGSLIRASLLAYDATEDRVRIVRFNLPSETFAPIRQATGLSVIATGEIGETFTLTHMPSVMAELDRCITDLQQHWNIGDAAQARLKSRATANLASFLTPNDYPDVAIREAKDGTVGFMLLVDEKGQIADCMLTMTSNVPVLDAQSCAILSTRAKFRPAIGPDGLPARDAVSSRIRWVMPAKQRKAR
jgi:hypothetical protein